MPWGCIGVSTLGASGPGTGSCGLPGTFSLTSIGTIPDMAAFSTNPRAPQLRAVAGGPDTLDTKPRKPTTYQG